MSNTWLSILRYHNNLFYLFIYYDFTVTAIRVRKSEIVIQWRDKKNITTALGGYSLLVQALYNNDKSTMTIK